MLHNILDLPGFMPVHVRDAIPPISVTFCLLPLVSQVSFARLRQICQLDGEVAPNTSRNSELSVLSVSSAASTFAQQ